MAALSQLCSNAGRELGLLPEERGKRTLKPGHCNGSRLKYMSSLQQVRAAQCPPSALSPWLPGAGLVPHSLQGKGLPDMQDVGAEGGSFHCRPVGTSPHRAQLPKGQR